MKYRSIIEAVVDYVQYRPDALCIADRNQAYSYAEFDSMIGRYAAVLQELGVKKENTVIVEGMQSAEFAAIEFGLHLLGAIFVPLESRCGLEKIKDTAKRCDAVLAVTSKEADCGELQTVTYVQLKMRLGCVDGVHGALPEGSMVSEILFSTGTTGKEKGIVLTHENDVAVAENIISGSRMKDDNVEMIPSPLNHSHGLRSFYANMLCGGAVVLQESMLDMKGFFAAMDRFGVNAMDLVPSALSILLRFSGEKLGEYREKLRYIEFGSAAMSAADRTRICELLPGIPLLNYYGSTESGRATVYNFNTDQMKPNCIGRPTCNTKIIIADETRKPFVSSKERTGLLASAGPMNMQGYLNDPAETERATDGIYVFSNDEAYIDADGDIILIGRKGDVINVGGKKVAPDEVEEAARKYPGIIDCGCAAVADPITGSAPGLFIQLEPGVELNRRELMQYLESKLEPFKIPKQIKVLEKIPRTFNGKLLRRELK